jgi:8-oxo-dGTP pyrophosphatase MutT (NUDIX family)
VNNFSSGTPTDSSRSGLISQVDRYLSLYPDEAEKLTPLLDQINKKSNPFDRRTLPGHITASSIVMEDGRLLMIFHPSLNKWLQPGGHLESGETPLQAAKREALEETGISCELHKWHDEHCTPIDIDIHPIPENIQKRESMHLHYDFRYLLCTDHLRRLSDKGDHESGWKLLQEIFEPNLRKLLEKLEKTGNL